MVIFPCPFVFYVCCKGLIKVEKNIFVIIDEFIILEIVIKELMRIYSSNIYT